MSIDAGAKRRRRFASLRSRIALVVVLAVIPGFIVSIIAVNDERESSREEAQRAAQTLAATTAARYDSLLRESQSLLQVLGNIPSPHGLVSVAFGGPNKRTLFGVSIRDVHVLAIDMQSQGFMGRPK